MKKTLSTLLTAAVLAGSAVTSMAPARAEGGRIAAGVAGGLLGGALIGGAIASSRPAYAEPAPVYVEGPPCYWRRERFWDGYGWQFRRVQVCQ